MLISPDVRDTGRFIDNLHLWSMRYNSPDAMKYALDLVLGADALLLVITGEGGPGVAGDGGVPTATTSTASRSTPSRSTLDARRLEHLFIRLATVRRAQKAQEQRQGYRDLGLRCPSTTGGTDYRRARPGLPASAAVATTTCRGERHRRTRRAPRAESAPNKLLYRTCPGDPRRDHPAPPADRRAAGFSGTPRTPARWTTTRSTTAWIVHLGQIVRHPPGGRCSVTVSEGTTRPAADLCSPPAAMTNPGDDRGPGAACIRATLIAGMLSAHRRGAAGRRSRAHRARGPAGDRCSTWSCPPGQVMATSRRPPPQYSWRILVKSHGEGWTPDAIVLCCVLSGPAVINGRLTTRLIPDTCVLIKGRKSACRAIHVC